MDLRSYLIRSGYWVHENGTLLPPLVNKHSMQIIRNFDHSVEKTLTYLVGYPNSGSCWVKYMMWNIMLQEHPSMLNEVDNMLRRNIIFTTLEYSSPETGEPNHQEVSHMLVQCPFQLVISTNLSRDIAPKIVPNQQNKAVFLVRNPKDVCVATLKALLSEKELQSRRDFEKYAMEFLEGHVPFGSWLDHTLSWWNHFKSRSNYLFLTYEEVRNDMRGTIQKLAKFMEKPLSKETTTAICKKCCLSVVPWKECRKEKDDFLESINAGPVDEWKDYFTVTLTEKFDEILKPKLAAVGLLDKMNF
ncbi:amine sulfotransferase-like [Ptychodera flava]|uniref:amine sulfotransferase-like n=1 Tax=Ptychodera flava TaxID=63121 RepID=UPI00396A5B85